MNVRRRTESSNPPAVTWGWAGSYNQGMTLLGIRTPNRL